MNLELLEAPGALLRTSSEEFPLSGGFLRFTKGLLLQVDVLEKGRGA